MEAPFLEIAFAVIGATLLAYLARLLRQPPLIGYILAGIFLGPAFLDAFSSTELFKILSTFGAAFLLFLVGLNLKIDILREIGPVAFFLGVGQMLITWLAGFWIARILDFSAIASAYMGMAVAFSSTIIVVKLLSDKEQLQSLHGKLSLGILLVQDLAAIVALVIMSGLSGNGDVFSGIIGSATNGVVLLFIAFFLGFTIIPKIFRFAAHSPELLFISGISWCFLLAAISASLGFSIEIGAFLAGITLSSLPFNQELIGRVKPLRDFFLLLFFVVLGAQMLVGISGDMAVPIMVFSLLVIVGKPLITMALLGWYGYRKKTSFLASLSLAQVSEFSLIIAFLGLQLGHIPQSLVSAITLLTVITILISTYGISAGEKIYSFFEPFLKIFERKKALREIEDAPDAYEVILIGFHRMGHAIYGSLRKQSFSTLVVDMNPMVISHASAKNIPAMFADMGNPEILVLLRQMRPRAVISTAPSFEDNLSLVQVFGTASEKPRLPSGKRWLPSGKLWLPSGKPWLPSGKPLLFTTAHTIGEALKLYSAGADYVILPHILGGEAVGSLIQHSRFSKKVLKAHKRSHLRDLQSRKKLLPSALRG